MRVLVAYATYYGATREIAERVADVLKERGVDVALKSADDAFPVDVYEAFVVGSAVHAGHWLKPAAEFVRRERRSIAQHPVWLFSSGPIGDAADKPQQEPAEVVEFRRSIAIEDHVVFGGAFDRASTANASWLARTVGRLIPEGDFRDWIAIEAWARQIARHLERTDRPVLAQ